MGRWGYGEMGRWGDPAIVGQEACMLELINYSAASLLFVPCSLFPIPCSLLPAP
ncbi:MAG: hypothetical protein F6K53_38210 [Moorea sp. SIO4A1]|nr:hypothetical protein [Moorena sp. SIO4A1]